MSKDVTRSRWFGMRKIILAAVGAFVLVALALIKAKNPDFDVDAFLKSLTSILIGAFAGNSLEHVSIGVARFHRRHASHINSTEERA